VQWWIPNRGWEWGRGGTHPPAPQPVDGGALGGDVEGAGGRVGAEHVVAGVVDLVAAPHVAPGRRLGPSHPGHRRFHRRDDTLQRRAFHTGKPAAIREIVRTNIT
jgi:hypothetical protein